MLDKCIVHRIKSPFLYYRAREQGEAGIFLGGGFSFASRGKERLSEGKVFLQR